MQHRDFSIRWALTPVLIVLAAAYALPARADMVTRESEITSIRLGQTIYVDDGSCPAGQIKQITGTKLSPNGILTVKSCVSRKNARH